MHSILAVHCSTGGQALGIYKGLVLHRHKLTKLSPRVFPTYVPAFFIMVAFSQIFVALSAVAGSLAAPAANPSADAPDFELTGTSLMRRQDYNQNYKTSGNVNFSPDGNGYSVSFSNAGDFVVGKGWKTGTTRYVLTTAA
jgi:hypothetical protein